MVSLCLPHDNVRAQSTCNLCISAPTVAVRPCHSPTFMLLPISSLSPTPPHLCCLVSCRVYQRWMLCAGTWYHPRSHRCAAGVVGTEACTGLPFSSSGAGRPCRDGQRGLHGCFEAGGHSAGVAAEDGTGVGVGGRSVGVVAEDGSGFWRTRTLCRGGCRGLHRGVGAGEHGAGVGPHHLVVDPKDCTGASDAFGV